MSHLVSPHTTMEESQVAAPPAPRVEPAPFALRGHLPALDGLRGVAILLVMLLHFVGDTTATNGFERVVGYVTGHGLVGVDLFFVLSGFLITGILFDARHRPRYFRNFYARRTLRIFPLYYGVLLVALVVMPAAGLEWEALGQLQSRQAWLWLYGANFHHALEGRWALSYLNHFWSLAVEEHFYLVWPLLVWALRDRPQVLLWGSLGISIASRAAGVAAAHMSASPTVGLMTPFQLQGIALGGMLAVLARLPGGVDKILRWTPWVAGASAVLLAAGMALHRTAGVGQALFSEVRPTLFVLLLASLLVAAVFTPSSFVSRALGLRVLTFFGTYSYGLYVFHHFVSYFFLEHGTEFAIAERVGSHTAAVFVQASMGFAISIAAAYASYHGFEKPFLSLKRRFSA